MTACNGSERASSNESLDETEIPGRLAYETLIATPWLSSAYHPRVRQPRLGGPFYCPILRWAERSEAAVGRRGLHSAPVVQRCLGNGCHVPDVTHQGCICRGPALEVARENTTTLPNLAHSTAGYPPGAAYNSNSGAKSASCPQNHAVSCPSLTPGQPGEHPVHDTLTKTYRHLNFFQHECELKVRVPRVKLPEGKVAQVSPPWAGKLSGFTLLFEAFVLLLARETTFTGASRISGLSVHRVMALCEKYVNEAVSAADLSEVRRVALDETSRAKGHAYVTLFADADPDPARRRVIFVAEGKDAATVEAFEANLRAHHGKPSEIESVSIDMSPAFISGVSEHLPHAQITFDKFHVIAHASEALDKMRRIEQKLDPNLKGKRWVLLKDRASLTAAQRTELDGLLAKMNTTRTARAWQYREELREILTRTERCAPAAQPLVQQRVALEGRADEGSRPNDPYSFRRHPRLGEFSSDQRVPRGHQWALPSCQAQGPRVRPVPYHSHGHLHDRRQTRLLPHQPVRHRIAHSFFNRAVQEEPRGGAS